MEGFNVYALVCLVATVLIVPFRYTAVLFATMVGFLVWGETPNALAWCAIGLLIGSGIHLLRVSRRTRSASPAPD